MNDFEYHSPTKLKEACALLKKYNGTAQVLAGGTDLIPKMHYRKLAPKHVINIKRIPDLNKITYDPSKGLTLGTLVNFNDLIYSEIVQTNYPILTEISRKIATHQIRNLATVGGNLCNAAPSADSVPILVALDSTVTLTGPGGKKRILPLEQFFIGPGATALKPGEILTHVNVPIIKSNSGMTYIKHTTRKALDIAVVGVAALIQLEPGQDKCMSSRIVIASCAPTPLRIHKAEKILTGKKIADQAIAAAAQTASAAVEPITDVRACDVYRREMVEVQCKRAIEDAISRVYSSTIDEEK
jgi:CO/xanthine dehydrogenase FAD-binding subunit